MKSLLIAALCGIATSCLIAGAAVHAAPATKFRLCTGDASKNYFKVGHIVKKNSTSVDVEVIETKGSLENLERLVGGGCDGAFVQSDALMVYSDKNAQAISSLERAGVLYQEQVNLVCNRASGITHIYDLTAKNRIAVGGDGSGARVTLDAFKIANKKRYGDVQIAPLEGVRALNAVSDGRQVQCLLTIAAQNSSLLRNDAQSVGDKVVLAGTDDGDLEKVKDARGNAVYGFDKVPAGTYPRIQPTGAVWGTKPVGVLTVEALFVTSVTWVNANETANDRLLRAFNGSSAEIKEAIGAR